MRSVRLPSTFVISLCVLTVAFGCGREEVPQKEPASNGSQSSSQTGGATPVSTNEPVAEAEEGFTLLRLADFEAFQSEPGTWSESNGLLVTTGKPKGYLYSKKAHRNFTWRADYRLVPTNESDPKKQELPNTGFMLFIQEPHKIWPRSLEVQGRHDEMASIKSNGGVPALTISDDPAARGSARKSVGEWNSLEVRCVGGAVTAELNGTVICKSEPGELQEGLIGVQAENFPVEFRRLRIRDDN